MHSICKKYKGLTARMQALRDWSTYIRANLPHLESDWEEILLTVDETKLDDEHFAELFIKYCSMGGKDIDEIS